MDLDKAILKFFHIQVQGLTFTTTLETRIDVIQGNKKLDMLHKCLSIGDFSGLGSVPGAPNGVVGLDQPLKELKEVLLKGEVRIKVISAPGGCGKTTLAKMLCNDPHIQSKAFFIYMLP